MWRSESWLAVDFESSGNWDRELVWKPGTKHNNDHTYIILQCCLCVFFEGISLTVPSLTKAAVLSTLLSPDYLQSGHPWDQSKCPDYWGGLISGVLIRKPWYWMGISKKNHPQNLCSRNVPWVMHMLMNELFIWFSQLVFLGIFQMQWLVFIYFTIIFIKLIHIKVHFGRIKSIFVEFTLKTWLSCWMGAQGKKGLPIPIIDHSNLISST